MPPSSGAIPQDTAKEEWPGGGGQEGSGLDGLRAQGGGTSPRYYAEAGLAWRCGCGSHPLAGWKHLSLVRRHQAVEVEPQCLGVPRGTMALWHLYFLNQNSREKRKHRFPIDSRRGNARGAIEILECRHP